MKQLGVEFTHVSPKVEEDTTIDDPVRRVEENSLRKASSVHQPGSLVVGSDTVVALETEILGKPVDEEVARVMLSRLSGNSHKVYTGISIIDSDTGRANTDHACTEVWFRELSSGEIDEYVKSGEPLDKAGGYGIQGLGVRLVDRYEGSYTNIVGLPLELLGEMLRKFDIDT